MREVRHRATSNWPTITHIGGRGRIQAKLPTWMKEWTYVWMDGEMGTQIIK